MKTASISLVAILAGSNSAIAQSYNQAEVELIGNTDPDNSQDFIRNIFTKKELPKSSIFIKSDSDPVNVVLIYSKSSMYSFSLVNGRRVARCQTPCEVKIPNGAPFLVRAWKENFSVELTTAPPEWKLKIPGAPGFGYKIKNNFLNYKVTPNPDAPSREQDILE